jgi:hypothetical protein
MIELFTRLILVLVVPVDFFLLAGRLSQSKSIGKGLSPVPYITLPCQWVFCKVSICDDSQYCNGHAITVRGLHSFSILAMTCQWLHAAHYSEHKHVSFLCILRCSLNSRAGYCENIVSIHIVLTPKMRHWLLSLGALLASGDSTNAAFCRCQPSQPCWPSEANWAALNTSVEGNLVAVKPFGYPCHDANFNDAECNIVKENAYSSSYRSSQPGSTP